MPTATRSASPESVAFARYLRTGHRTAPLEVKYNHNHDPDDGRFTFADGKGGAERALRAARVARRCALEAPRQAAHSVQRRIDKTRPVRWRAASTLSFMDRPGGSSVRSVERMER